MYVRWPSQRECCSLWLILFHFASFFFVQFHTHTHISTTLILTDRPNKMCEQASKQASERMNVTRLKSLTSLYATFLSRVAFISFYFFLLRSFVRSFVVMFTRCRHINVAFKQPFSRVRWYKQLIFLQMQFLISGCTECAVCGRHAIKVAKAMPKDSMQINECRVICCEGKGRKNNENSAIIG